MTEEFFVQQYEQCRAMLGSSMLLNMVLITVIVLILVARRK